MSEQQKIFFGKLRPFLDRLQRELEDIGEGEDIPLFYEPIHYVLALPGKRIRPLLTLLSAMTCNASLDDALPAAAAVELMHNFTLVHDDIMDNDDTRRGQPTVHKKWDVGTAILAGDGLMGLAFKKLLQSPRGDVLRMAQRFNEIMLVICEGQGLDKMFEQDENVSFERYMDMIRRKTAVLIELSCELGALAAQAREDEIEAFRQFGLSLGLAFQIQDDWLDVMADEKTLGKKVGSDWQQHKQTVLTIRLKEKKGGTLPALSLEAFKEQLLETGVADEVQAMYQKYFDQALQALNVLPQNQYNALLRELTQLIENRQW